ncbi:hypothetical protein DL764_000959 [Monosporascus ibericus]|uniref:EGF domain-specific O-linked N-acetylglucosamine transferase n=1 Tax=Monosporascus ibericus TaxID=155417 RepID=A0A4Q4TTY3_9PEZI|nr:hypothetical protein DL764_000959 [Monosporascus ibericus]
MKTDSFCFAQGAALNVEDGKFQLDCKLRQFSKQEEEDGLLPFDRLPGYWYGTGPSNVFALAINVQKSKPHPAGGGKETEEKQQEASESFQQETNSTLTPPKKLLLLKREGETNPWHSLMEIFSTYMSFDILRMPGSSRGDNAPLFRDPGDSDDTQVVILDDRDDGPYFDLWTLFARRKPLRLGELLGDPSTGNNLRDVDLIIPLAGSSNPFWKDDEQVQQCNNAPMLNVFSRRVLDFYGIQDPPIRKNEKPIVVTFVNRRESRRLQNQRFLLGELQRRNSHITVQMVDFAAIPFSEQLRVARETDVLVGAHGAGLTQSLFMRRGAGALVEIQPERLDHNGFRNVAGMLSLGYYRVHARTIPPEEWREGEEEEEGTQPKDKINLSRRTGNTNDRRASRQNKDYKESSKNTAAAGSSIGKRDEWHWRDIDIEESRFFDVVEAAIRFMYAKGPWSYDLN